MDIKDLLDERGQVHGSFREFAWKAFRIRRILENAGGAGFVSVPTWEAVNMVCHKLCRVSNGKDLYYKDNWVDIAGYARLAYEEAEPGCGGLSPVGTYRERVLSILGNKYMPYPFREAVAEIVDRMCMLVIGAADRPSCLKRIEEAAMGVVDYIEKKQTGEEHEE